MVQPTEHPSDPQIAGTSQAWWAEIQALRGAGRLDEVATRLKSAVAPGSAPDARAIEALASVLRATGDVDGAIAAYFRLRAVQPDSESGVVALAVLLAARDGDVAGVHLLDCWEQAYGASSRVRAQRGRLLHLARRRNAADFHSHRTLLRDQLAAIEREISSDPLFEPSLFWQKHIAMHGYLLEMYGIEYFKRTVSHNYHNWLMCSVTDPQVKRLMELTGRDFETSDDPTGPTDDVGFHYITHIDQHPSEHPTYNLIEDGPYAGTVLYPHYPLADPQAALIYGEAVRALWGHTAARHPSVMSRLYEVDIGNPVPVFNGTRPISSDLCHSVREQAELFAAAGFDGTEALVVAELGAGHGRLAELFGRTTNYRYVIIDIAPALLVSEYYLARLFCNEPIFRFRHFDRFDEIAAELAAARFAFFTPNQLALLPGDFCDVFVNVNSLMEMRPEQISHFLSEIGRVTSGYFYCKQWIEWTNGIDGVQTRQSDFDPGPGWQCIATDRDEIYPDFFTAVWHRAREGD